MGTTFEQFLAVLRNSAARRRIALDLSDAEAERIASDSTLARAYYANWARQAPSPPGGPRVELPPPAGLSTVPGDHVLVPSATLRPTLPTLHQPARQVAAVTRPAVPVNPASAATTQPFPERHPAFLAAYIAATLSLLAPLPWPYEYYVLLRWLLTVTAVLITVHAVRSRQQAWLVASVPIAVLWAPAAFIILDRGVWAVLNVLAAIVLCFAGSFIKSPQWPRPDGKPRWQWWQISLLIYGIGFALALLSVPAGGGSAGFDCDVFYERSGTFCY